METLIPSPQKRASGNSDVSGSVRNDLWSAAGSIVAMQNRVPPLTRSDAAGPAPLSLAQERLWALEQSEPGSPYYHIPLTWHIEGAPNLDALRRSINYVVRRHEALRTSFPSGPDGPFQRLNDFEIEIPVVKLNCNASVPGPAEFEVARNFVRQPFDLEKGPLLRLALYQLADSSYWLVMAVHQIIFDGASMRVFNRDFAECYTAFTTGREPQLAPLPVRYSDFARWQRASLDEETLKADDAWWSALLRKKYEPLRFQTDHPRKNSGLIPGTQFEFELPKNAMGRLKKLSFESGATPFAAFLGLWQAFLGKITRQDDVLTLVSIAARNQREVRNIIGLVANVLPMRLNLEGNPSLSEVLRRAGSAVSSALAHQSLPLSRILEKLPSSRAANTAPALQVLVIYNNAPLPPLRLPGITFTPSIALDNGASKFDFVLDVADTPEGIHGHIKYRSDLFEPATINRLLADWSAFVDSALNAPEQLLGIVPSAHRRPLEAGLVLDAPATHTANSLKVKTQLDSASYVAPRSDLEKKLAAVWESVFEIHPIGIHDNFFGLGGHSLTAVKLINAIEKDMGTKLLLSKIFEEPTIARLGSVMDCGCDSGSKSSLVEIQPRGSKTPLFLVHGVGGGMFWGYNNLSHHLGADQPVYGFKSRGLEGLEEFSTIESLAAHYVADLRKFKAHGPYRLGGYCFGGNVAFEMARQLEAAGEKVDLLLLINCWPNNSSYTRLSLSPAGLGKAAVNFVYRLGHQIDWAIRQPGDFFKARSRWIVKRASSLISGNRADRLAVEDVVDLASRPEHEQKLWRTHVEAWLNYVPRLYSGNIVLLRTRGHPLICSYDHEMGWGPYAQGGVTVRMCPGDHESILESKNVGDAAREVAMIISRLDDAAAAQSKPHDLEVYKLQPSISQRIPTPACLTPVKHSVAADVSRR